MFTVQTLIVKITSPMPNNATAILDSSFVQLHTRTQQSDVLHIFCKPFHKNNVHFCLLP